MYPPITPEPVGVNCTPCVHVAPTAIEYGVAPQLPPLTATYCPLGTLSFMSLADTVTVDDPLFVIGINLVSDVPTTTLPKSVVEGKVISPVPPPETVVPI